ncbi:MAG: outer membrane beta-barrel protein [Tannerella sp.]|nr:outer membrane beta-barrel protein [Tannerella sp.]
MITGILFLSFAFGAKAVVPVFGKVVEAATEAPLEYANLLLLSLPDSAFISGAVSGEDGSFRFPGIDGGRYVLKASFIGFETGAVSFDVSGLPVDLGMIQMKTSNELTEVVVTAGMAPFSAGLNGGVVAHVATTLLSTVGSANDVLQRMPGVTALDGRITVFGKGAPIVYINNRKVYDHQELERLESSEISTIELLTSPGARYDAEGRAVLLIRTKQRLDGLALSLTERLSYASRLRDYESVNLSYTKNNLNLFASYTHSYQKRKTNESDETILDAPGGLWRHDSHLPTTSSSTLHQLSTGFDLSLNDKHAVGGQYRYMSSSAGVHSPSHTSTSLDGRPYDELASLLDMEVKPDQHLVNAFYKGEFGEKYTVEADVDYLKNHDFSHQKTAETSNMESRTVNTYSQSDYNLYAGKLINTFKTAAFGQLEFGGEYSHIAGDGFLTNPEGYTRNNLFTTAETKAAGFLSYAHSVNDFKFTVGLRYEFAKSRATSDSVHRVIIDRTYHYIYPNLSISKRIRDVQLSLAFNSRAKRPGFSDLSGNVAYVNRFLFQTGNPYLTQTNIYDVNLQATYRMFHLNTGFTYEKDPIAYDFSGDETPGAILITSLNYPKHKEIYAMLNLNHTVGFWQPNYTVSVTKPYMSVSYNGVEKHYSRAGFSLEAYNDFRLPRAFVFSLNFEYSSNAFYYLAESKAYKYMDIGLRKSMFDKRLTLNMELRDVFNWLETASSTKVNNVEFNQHIKRETRYAMLTVTYQFNNYSRKYRGGSAAQNDMNRF